MKKALFILLTIFTAFLAGCQTGSVSNDHAEHQNHEMNQEILKTGKGIYTVEFKAVPAEVKSGEKVDLILTVRDDKGEAVKDLQTVHEKPMHLLIVSSDLDEFYHLHPEAQEGGMYKTDFTFPNGGQYKLYTDFTPLNSAPVVQDFPLKVSGNAPPWIDLQPDEKFEKTVSGLRFVMSPDAEIVSNKELMLTFQVFDAQTNKPVTDLQPYLGAMAHFVIISKDLQDFVHAHPVSKENVKTENTSAESQTHTHGSETQPHNDKLMSQAAESIVSAHVSFPKAGIYKIFAQFQRSGKIITVPFAVNVKEGESGEALVSNINIPEDAYKITISKDGFVPQEVTLDRSKFSKLAFVRIDKENCAGEVVFKELDVRKKLPVGEVVTVDLPSDFQGKTINFACGMDMYQGKIIVQ